MQLSIICGFALFYAWYLIVFFGVFVVAPSHIGFTALHIEQVVFFVSSIIATSFILHLFSKRDSVALGHSRFLYLACLIPGSVAPLFVILDGVGIVISSAVFYLAGVTGGVAAAIGFMLWEDLTMHGYLNRGVLHHGIIFCAGGVLFLVATAFLSKLQLGAVAEFFLIASIALLTFIMPRCDTIENRPVAPVKQYLRSSWHIDVLSVLLGVAFGYAFIMLYHMSGTSLLAIMAIAICVDLAFSILLGHGKWIPFVGAVRICVAAVACALLLYACPGDTAQRIALCIIVVFWFLFRTLNGGSLTDLAMRNGFSILYASTRGKLAANIGFAAGLALGICALEFAEPSGADFYIPLILVGAFILAALFLLPFDNAPTTAGYKTLALVDMHEPSDEGVTDSKEFSTHVAKALKLSPRESEVLVYVMKGRNAKHVAEKLFISESTAKTHIANIYRKAGVHSQQELLDKLETMR